MANRKKSIPADITEAAAVTTEAAPTAETVTAQPAETAAEITAAAAEEKPAAKRGRRPAAAKTEKAAETTAKRGASRKGISYESVVDAAKKKILAANITKIKYPVSANIELSGSVTGDFYIYIDADNQTIAVEPYKYNNHDVSFRADADELLAVLKGKKNIYDALSEGNIKVSGITTKAILLIDAAF